VYNITLLIRSQKFRKSEISIDTGRNPETGTVPAETGHMVCLGIKFAFTFLICDV